MRSQRILILALLLAALSLASLATSCGSAAGSPVGDPSRTTSDVYNFVFDAMPSPLENPLATYYVVHVGENGNGDQIFEAVTPGEAITNYTQYSVDGLGPLGNGGYHLRVFDPLEYVWDTREDWFYVSGL